MAFTLGRYLVSGEVTTLDDPRFSQENARIGLWRRLDFVLTLGPGIYFLEPYDPNKIPVLFVHGISGYPAEFRQIVAHLDRDRFRPWFFFYPSGAGLQTLAGVLTEQIVELRAEHDFDELCVVAHSMGELLARGFIFESERASGRDDVRSFISISSPFGGDERAAKGVEEAPKDLPLAPSWRDMATGSPYLDSIFYVDRERKVPDGCRTTSTTRCCSASTTTPAAPRATGSFGSTACCFRPCRPRRAAGAPSTPRTPGF